MNYDLIFRYKEKIKAKLSRKKDFYTVSDIDIIKGIEEVNKRRNIHINWS